MNVKSTHEDYKVCLVFGLLSFILQGAKEPLNSSSYRAMRRLLSNTSNKEALSQ